MADWGCVRSSSYVYPGESLLSDAQVAGYERQGFEVALHLDTGCANFTADSLRQNWIQQRAAFLTTWAGSAPSPTTNRTHCIAWSDWATQPVVEREFGVRLDTNYYYWPPSWHGRRPGVFTGSGIPMRFANLDGSLIDVYQATTQLVDEGDSSGPPIDYSVHIAALLDRALGPQSYYGAFTANIHTDRSVAPAVTIVQAAQARGVPVISARQLLAWVDGRNGSSFSGLTYDGANLRFVVNRAPGARGLEARRWFRWPDRPGGSGAQPKRCAHAHRRASGQGRGVRGVPGGPRSYVAAYPPRVATAASRRGKRRDRPRVRVRLRVHMGKLGYVKLRVTCPVGKPCAEVDLQLRRRNKTVGRRRTRVRGGKTRTVGVLMGKGARATITEAGSLRVVARSAAGDSAGNRAVTSRRITILAPRSRRPLRRPPALDERLCVLGFHEPVEGLAQSEIGQR